MSSEDEEMEFKYRPDTPEDENDLSPPAGIPSTSQSRYNRIYQDFHKWNKIKGATPVSQAVLLKYFSELAERSKPPTLWAYYSMLKNTLKLYDNTDMHSWSKLRNFIKQQNTGYKSVKSKLFTRTEIEKFINEAPDDQWLDLKVHERQSNCNGFIIVTNSSLFVGRLHFRNQWRVRFKQLCEH